MKVPLTKSLIHVYLITSPPELLRAAQICWGSSIRHCNTVKAEVVKFACDVNEGKIWRIPRGSPVAGELHKIIIINFGVKKQSTILRVKMSAKQAYFVTSVRTNYLLITFVLLRWGIWMASKSNTFCSYYYSVTYSLLLDFNFFFLTGLTGWFPWWLSRNAGIKDKLSESLFITVQPYFRARVAGKHKVSPSWIFHGPPCFLVQDSSGIASTVFQNKNISIVISKPYFYQPHETRKTFGLMFLSFKSEYPKCEQKT